MTAYLIVYGRDPSDRLAAYAYATREAARTAIMTPRVPEAAPSSGGCSYVIEREEDVTFSGQLLVRVFNGLTGNTVSRFESRAIGVRRLLEALSTVAVAVTPAPTEEVIQVSEDNGTEKKTRRATPFTPEHTIKVLIHENPKRAGTKTAEKFAQLHTGMTIADARKLGYSSHDLEWEVKHEYITIHAP